MSVAHANHPTGHPGFDVSSIRAGFVYRPPVSDPRLIRGALNGSRFIEQPHIRPEVDAARAFVAGSAPALVEVGFDHGRRLHSTALHNPDWRVLGLEVRKQRVIEARERAERDGLTNVLPWRMDARIVFAGVFEPASLAVVEVLFPTPWWHAKLRAKRLLIEPAFLADVARALEPGGVLHIATDVPEYAAHIDGALADCALTPVDRPAHLPECTQQSRREWKCARDGIPVHRWYLQRPAPTDAARDTGCA